jgi:hypothetical protein
MKQLVWIETTLIKAFSIVKMLQNIIIIIIIIIFFFCFLRTHKIK